MITVSIWSDVGLFDISRLIYRRKYFYFLRLTTFVLFFNINLLNFITIRNNWRFKITNFRSIRSIENIFWFDVEIRTFIKIILDWLLILLLCKFYTHAHMYAWSASVNVWEIACIIFFYKCVIYFNVFAD